MKRFLLATVTVTVTGLALAGCSSSDSTTGGGTTEGGTTEASAETCTADQLSTVTDGTLTIATGEPAYEPWVVNDDPASGEGFEAAVAMAAAERLGFTDDSVAWVRTTFDSAIAPGPKTFDWNLQQYTITEDRKNAVDFSSPYYEASQAVVTYEGSPIADATSLADLKNAKLGAAVGSTSLDDAQTVIDPTNELSVFNDNSGAVSALQNGQIDGIVIDLPSAFYLSAVEIDNGMIVGQLPGTASGQSDAFGILLAKDSPITACTSWAIDQLTEDGTLVQLQEKWLATEAGAPVLQ